ncbi:MAG: hypothetical protein H7Z38_09235 [Rubrivivax sp.]|nr:hypothetical protein [Pyrinomonadaceae bacterium]
MSAKKILTAAIVCLTLLFAAGTRAEAGRGGAVASASDGAGRLTVGNQRRSARRRANKKISKQTKEAAAQESVWGGDHVRLNEREGGAALEFDCARGEISETLKTDAEGHFDLPGTFTRDGPGPIRVNIKPIARPARYVGRIEGRTMTFRVKLTDTNQETEVFTLTRGSEGRLWKCR